MGSYWGPRIAAYDPRVKALVGAMGTYLQKDTIFKHAKPTYRANYMYMSNIHDEDEFDAMAARMTLEPLADMIRCPTLLAMGEFDELCPLEDGERMFDLLTCPKELWVYEDETHTFGSRLPGLLSAGRRLDARCAGGKNSTGLHETHRSPGALVWGID